MLNLTTKNSLFLLALGLLCHTQLSAQIKDYLQAGIQNNQNGNYLEAIQNFDVAISLAPESKEAYGHRGYAKQKLHQYQAAIDDYDKALAIHPNDIWLLGNRGAMKIKVGYYQAAVEDFDRAIQLDAGNAWQYVMRAEAKYQMIQRNAKRKAPFSYFQVVDDLTKGIAINPQFGFAFHRRSQARLDSLFISPTIPPVQETQAICQDWMTALGLGNKASIDPLQQNCDKNLTTTLAQKLTRDAQFAYANQRWADLITPCEQILKINPPDSNLVLNAWELLAEAKLRQNQFWEAIELYNQMIQYASLNTGIQGKAYYLKAFAHAKLNNNLEALEDFNRAINLGYRFSWVYHERALIKNAMGDVSSACEDWEVSDRKGYPASAEMLKKYCKTGLFGKKSN